MGKNKLMIKYKFKDEYNPKYINGAHGSASRNGDIVINFYLERAAVPKSIEHMILEDNTLDSDPKFQPEDYNRSVIRYIESGVIMNLETAKIIRDFIDKQIKTIEKSDE